MVLAMLVCIGLSACQPADKSKDQQEPVKKEENKKTEDETESFPMEIDDADIEGESGMSNEDSAGESEEDTLEPPEIPDETDLSVEEEQESFIE